MKKKDPELKLLNDLYRIIQWMSEVPENEKAESKGFKKAFSQLQRAYPTTTAVRQMSAPKRKNHKLVTTMKLAKKRKHKPYPRKGQIGNE